MANEVLNSLLKDYEKRKTSAELDLEKRKEELYQKFPKLQEIEDELNSLAFKVTKNLINKNDTDIKNDFEKKIEELKYKKVCILQEANISLDYLKPFYSCPICKDTGYVTDNNYNTKMCSCLKQKLFDISFNKSNMSNLEKENFDNFNLNLFSKEVDIAKYKFNISPRDNMLNIKNKCIEFINNFDDPNYHNLLFSGNTGLR